MEHEWCARGTGCSPDKEIPSVWILSRGLFFMQCSSALFGACVEADDNLLVPGDLHPALPPALVIVDVNRVTCRARVLPQRVKCGLASCAAALRRKRLLYLAMQHRLNEACMQGCMIDYSCSSQSSCCADRSSCAWGLCKMASTDCGNNDCQH